MRLILATALPVFAPATGEAALRALCARWERLATPRMSPAQRAHCRRFAPEGAALRARASRFLVRQLALRALPARSGLDMDAQGRPLVTGVPGWAVAFSHSGEASFCLVLGPRALSAGMAPAGPGPALDAEVCRGATTICARAFPQGRPGPSPRWPLRRWLLAEALFKALGAPASGWPHVAALAQRRAGGRSGSLEACGLRLGWQFAAAPGHALCVALPEAAPSPLRLGWIAWQALS